MEAGKKKVLLCLVFLIFVLYVLLDCLDKCDRYIFFLQIQYVINHGKLFINIFLVTFIAVKRTHFRLQLIYAYGTPTFYQLKAYETSYVVTVQNM